jgi:hypothetical protein
MATAATREQPQVLSLEDSFDHEAPQQDLHGGFMSPDSYEDLMWQGMGSDSGDDFRHPTERAAELIQQLVSSEAGHDHAAAPAPTTNAPHLSSCCAQHYRHSAACVITNRLTLLVHAAGGSSRCHEPFNRSGAAAAAAAVG